MWESYIGEAQQIIEGAGIVAFLSVVREVAEDPSLSDRLRANLMGALEAFEG